MGGQPLLGSSTGSLEPPEEGSYATFLIELQRLHQSLVAGETPVERIAAVLDGEASVALRSLVPIATRRRTGSFFTSTDLARLLADRLTGTLAKDSIVDDPSCGAGDLLLSVVPLLWAWGPRPTMAN